MAPGPSSAPPRHLGANLGEVLVGRRRDGSEPVGRYQGRRVGGFPVRGLHVLVCLRPGHQAFGLPPRAVDLPHGCGAAVTTGPPVQRLEFIKVATPDAGALGQ